MGFKRVATARWEGDLMGGKGASLALGFACTFGLGLARNERSVQ